MSEPVEICLATEYFAAEEAEAEAKRPRKKRRQQVVVHETTPMRGEEEEENKNVELRHIIAQRLAEYFTGSRFPLLKITERINRLEGGAEFCTAFSSLVLRSATVEHGITFALHTYMLALEALVFQTQMALAERFDNGRGLKQDVALRISLQQVSLNKLTTLKEVVAIVSRGDESNFDARRIYRDVALLALYNDQQLKHLASYEEAGDEAANVFIVRVNGRLVCAMIAPRRSLRYTLQRNESPYRDSYKKLHDEAVRLILVERTKDAEIATLRKQLQKVSTR